MRLKLDLPAERWQFIKSKLEPFKNDSETITLFCHAIDSFDLEESIPQKIFQVLSASGKNPFQFPKARTLQDCNGGAGLVTEISRMGLSLPKLEITYYQFLLDNFRMEKK
tara:strand:- start:31 stop:360 length:330 start_codon:yes stop_codon:yes gene_type:complete